MYDSQPTLIKPSIDFLDALCKVTRFDRNWNFIDIQDFGRWVYQEGHPATVLREVESKEQFMEDHKLSIISEDNGAHPVRHICGVRIRLKEPAKIGLSFYVNIIVPNEYPLNKNKVRYEIYNNKVQAERDAEEEQQTEGVLKVETKSFDTWVKSVG